MPAKQKSRAEEARRRRRLHRMRQVVLQQAHSEYMGTSSDDDVVPPPVMQQARTQDTGTSSSSDHDVRPASHSATTSQHDMGRRREEIGGRERAGRRLLYGHPDVLPNISEGELSNDASFSDISVAIRYDNEDVPTDELVMNSDPQTTSEESPDHPLSSGEEDGRRGGDESVATPTSSEDSNGNQDVDMGPSVKEDVARFVTEYSLTVAATRDLLAIFRKAGVTGLPKDRRGLLQTPRSVPDVIDKCGGSYKYLGIEDGLSDFLKQHPDVARRDDNLSISVNVDGLPLHKSSKSQFWPILCKVGRGEPFIVGLYYGHQKPTSVDEYLEDFLEEYEHLKAHGMHFNGKRYNVHVRCWICDAPARAFLKCIKGHTGYYACERCKVQGSYEEGKVIYPVDGVYEERTDAEFAAMAYYNGENRDDHQKVQPSPLIAAGLNCVSGVVIDCMHNVYLGTWKRLLQFLFSGSRARCRLSNAQKHQLDNKLLRLRLPSEFSRQPRSLFELDYWKATEYRSSLLYTGLVFLKGIVSQNIYALYVKLNVAMNILHTENDDRRTQYLPYARELLLEFIRDSKHLLGPDYVVYNVHSMSHAPDDVENFGCSLNHISAFPFENHLQGVKKLVKGPHNPIVQVFSRLSERRHQNFFKHQKVIEPYISTRSKDSVFFFHRTMEFGMIQRRRRRDGMYDVLVFSAAIADNYFQQPCESKIFGIYLVKNLDRVQARPKIMSKDSLTHKVVLMAMENGRDYVLIPMLHDAEI